MSDARTIAIDGETRARTRLMLSQPCCFSIGDAGRLSRGDSRFASAAAAPVVKCLRARGLWTRLRPPPPWSKLRYNIQ